MILFCGLWAVLEQVLLAVVLAVYPVCTRCAGASAEFGVESSLFPCWPHADTEYEYFDAGSYESCLLHTVLIKDLKMEHWGSE